MKHQFQGNLLVGLHKWAKPQNENFTTEAFVHLLNYLLRQDKKTAAALLYKLTDGWLQLSEKGCLDVELDVQQAIETGTLDIKLKAPGHLAIIEVKVGSRPSSSQLRKYKAYLKAAKIAKTILILLTQYPVGEELAEKPDLPLRWYKVAEWLEAELIKADQDSRILSAFLIRQFLDFLHERSITMEHVEKDLVGGIRSLISLMDMLQEAIVACGAEPKWVAGTATSNGHKFTLKKREYWVGISYKEPDTVRFKAFGVVEELAGKLGYGEVKIRRNKAEWRNRLDLATEELNFFALEKANQIERLESYIQKSLASVAKVYVKH